MSEKSKSDPNAELHRTLNNACRKWGAREIRLRYLPKPSLSRCIAEALIEHGRVVEKMRADISAGELDPDTSMGAFVIQYSGRCSTIRLRSLGFNCLSGLVMKPAFYTTSRSGIGINAQSGSSGLRSNRLLGREFRLSDLFIWYYPMKVKTAIGAAGLRGTKEGRGSDVLP